MPNHTLHKNVYLEKNRSAAQQSMMSQTFSINTYEYDHYRESRYFPHSSRPDLGPTQHPAEWALRLFPGGKASREYR
jgi:hypothetical protein